MPKKIIISCDQCQKDITTTGEIPEIRIVVNSESIPYRPGSMMALVGITDPVPETAYFCSLEHLSEWASVRAAEILKPPW